MPDISQINMPNNDGSMTYNLKDASVPHSSLPAVSGGTDLSLVTTGEKAEWQDKGNYVIRGTNTTSNTFGHWTGNIPIPELYNGLIITYICSRNTIDVSSCDLELTFPNGSTSGRIEVVFDDGVNVSTEYQIERYVTLTYIDADHTSWGAPAWIVIAPSVLQWYVDDTDDGNYPLLFSEYAGRVTLNTTNCGAYKDTTFWYNPSTHNLHTEKVNGYTLASACEKQVDAEVEQSSDNLPTSDAVYNAIDNIHIQTKTVSGAIATFNDASGDVPFATLKSDINPVQDLHGYSKPWSGGGGKNKANKANDLPSGSGITVTVANDGTLTINGTSTEVCYIRGYFNCPDSTATYTWALFNNKAFESGVEFSVRTSDNSSAGGWARVNATNKTLSFTPSATPTKWQLQISSGITFNNAVFKPMIVSGNTAPTDYEPYENICPISGFNALNVTRTGKNLFNPSDVVEGYMSNTNGAINGVNTHNHSSGLIKVVGGEKYIITTSQVGGQWGAWYDASNNFISGFSGYDNAITAPNNAVYCRFTIEYLDNNPSYASNVMFEKGQTRSNYKPYNGQTATVNFGQTVYGGVADVTNGKVTVTHGIVDLGTLTWTKDTTTLSVTVFRANIGDRKGGSTDFICTNYEALSGDRGLLVNNNNAIATWNTQASQNVAIRDDNLSSGDATAFKTAMSGVMLCYALATPIEISTTPENLTAIVGQNNVYGDTNGDTTVEYFSGDCDGIIKLLKALSVI